MTRPGFAALALATVGLGLAVHAGAGTLPPALADVGGDALYAAMIAWLAGTAAPRASIWRRAAAAFGVCVGIEISQLVREPHADAVRATRLGHLVLGSDFDIRDLAAYAGGVALAVCLERALTRGVRS